MIDHITMMTFEISVDAADMTPGTEEDDVKPTET